MSELWELQHFLVVCEHHSFKQAARSLHITQPALSKSIQRLERRLNAKLLDRSRAGVTPTPIGFAVAKRAQRLVGGFEELRRDVTLLSEGEIGELAVGVGPAMAETFVTVAIARLAERHPRARIVARDDHWAQLDEWLHDGKLDLYVADVSEAKSDQRVEVLKLPREDFVWFARRGHPLASRKRVTRADLLNYPIVSPRMPEWARRWFAEAVHPGEKFDPTRRYATVECENYAMLKRMVAAGDCISAALASTIACEVEAGIFATLPIKAAPLKTSAGIVHRRGRTLSPLAVNFIENVMETSKSVSGRRR